MRGALGALSRPTLPCPARCTRAVPLLCLDPHRSPHADIHAASPALCRAGIPSVGAAPAAAGDPSAAPPCPSRGAPWAGPAAAGPRRHLRVFCRLPVSYSQNKRSDAQVIFIGLLRALVMTLGLLLDVDKIPSCSWQQTGRKEERKANKLLQV